jgi:hypothetical protein
MTAVTHDSIAASTTSALLTFVINTVLVVVVTFATGNLDLSWLSLLAPLDYSKKLADSVGLNPIAQIITDLRHVLISSTKLPSMASLIGPLAFIPILISFAVFFVGLAVFTRLTPRLAESL